MPRIVRCGLVQATCDTTQGPAADIKKAALAKHQKFVEEAAAQGVKNLSKLCFCPVARVPLHPRERR